MLRDLRRRQVIVSSRTAAGRSTENVSAIARELPESVRSLIQRKMDALEDADRRLLAAASVQGMDFDTAIVAAALQLGRGRRREPAGTARARACARAVRRRARGAGSNADAALPLRASHVPERLLRVAAGDAQSGAEPRDRGAAGRSGTASSPSGLADIAVLFEVARDGVRAADFWNRAAQAAARLYAHDESARLAQRGLALLDRRAATVRARATAELALQMTYGAGDQDEQGIRGAGGRHAPTSARASCAGRSTIRRA